MLARGLNIRFGNREKGKLDMSKLIGRSYTQVDIMKVPEVFNLMRVAHYIYGHKLVYEEVRDIRFYGYSEIRKGLERLGVWMTCEAIKDALDLGSRFDVNVVGRRTGGLWIFSQDTRQVRNKDALIVQPSDWMVYLNFLKVCKDNKIVETINEYRVFKQARQTREIIKASIEKNTSGLKQEDFH